MSISHHNLESSIIIILNHLSLVEHGIHKHVRCNRFSVLYVNTNLLKRYLKASLHNLKVFTMHKNCVISVAICSLRLPILDFKQ